MNLNTTKLFLGPRCLRSRSNRSKIGLILSFGHFGTAKSFTTGKAGSEGFLKFHMSHEWHIPNPVQVTLFPHDWLSRRGKKKILHDRRSREWRIFFLSQLLSHEWGKSVMRTGFGMCHEWQIGNFPSHYRIGIPILKIEIIHKKVLIWLKGLTT